MNFRNKNTDVTYQTIPIDIITSPKCFYAKRCSQAQYLVRASLLQWHQKYHRQHSNQYKISHLPHRKHLPHLKHLHFHLVCPRLLSPFYTPIITKQLTSTSSPNDTTMQRSNTSKLSSNLTATATATIINSVVRCSQTRRQHFFNCIDIKKQQLLLVPLSTLHPRQKHIIVS